MVHEKILLLDKVNHLIAEIFPPDEYIFYQQQN
jgi:hypothetical protein